jgi:hypothetical protein
MMVKIPGKLIPGLSSSSYIDELCAALHHIGAVHRAEGTFFRSRLRRLTSEKKQKWSFPGQEVTMAFLRTSKP